MAQGDPVRAVLVDDHTVFRHGVKRMLHDDGLLVIGEAGNGKAGVQLVAELAPDVVLMDLDMPGMDGIEATAQIVTNDPHARVVVLTISTGRERFTGALMAGAVGYILKDSPEEEIVGAVRAAVMGDAAISPQLTNELVTQFRAVEADRRTRPNLNVQLTEREIEILRLVAEGKGNRMIANELFISPRTAKNHVANILEKLKVENRIQAAVFAVRNGFV